jgi:hypothetical protein
MKPEILALLKQSCGKILRITCSDGEVLVGRNSFVSESARDVICDFISSNRERFKRPEGSFAVAVKFADIEAVEVLPSTDDR